MLCIQKPFNNKTSLQPGPQDFKCFLSTFDFSFFALRSMLIVIVFNTLALTCVISHIFLFSFLGFDVKCIAAYIRNLSMAWEMCTLKEKRKKSSRFCFVLFLVSATTQTSCWDMKPYKTRMFMLSRVLQCVWTLNHLRFLSLFRFIIFQFWST